MSFKWYSLFPKEHRTNIQLSTPKHAFITNIHSLITHKYSTNTIQSWQKPPGKDRWLATPISLGLSWSLTLCHLLGPFQRTLACSVELWEHFFARQLPWPGKLAKIKKLWANSVNWFSWVCECIKMGWPDDPPKFIKFWSLNNQNLSRFIWWKWTGIMGLGYMQGAGTLSMNWNGSSPWHALVVGDSKHVGKIRLDPYDLGWQIQWPTQSISFTIKEGIHHSPYCRVTCVFPPYIPEIVKQCNDHCKPFKHMTLKNQRFNLTVFLVWRGGTKPVPSCPFDLQVSHKKIPWGGNIICFIHSTQVVGATL